MIKKIEINNYKGINNITVNTLNRLNIFIGQNNSNKTSLMESIFIGLEGHSMGIFDVLEQRNMEPSPENLSTLFNNIDVQKPISIDLHCKNEKSIHSKIEKINDKTQISFNETIDLGEKLEVLNGLTYRLTQQLKNKNKIKNKNKYEATYKFGKRSNKNGRQETSINIDVKTPKILNIKGAAFMTNRTSNLQALADQIKKLILNKKKSFLLEELEKFDSKIKDVFVDGKKIYFDVNGAQHLLPIESMGAGVETILEIAAAFSNSNSRLILIDELEVGLHHKSLKKVIQFILDKLKKDIDLQVFITTHSLEVIKMFSALSEVKTDLTAFRLERDGMDTEVIEYSDDLNENLKNGWEIR